jgi:hypothetical protein
MKLKAAYDTGHNLAVDFTLFSLSALWQEHTDCRFSLRNLIGSTLSDQIDHARQIVNEVARELVYLTGLGLEKGVVTRGQSQVISVAYPEFQPKLKNIGLSQAVWFHFKAPYSYVWSDGKTTRWHLTEPELETGWLRVLQPVSEPQSFKLPALVLKQAGEDYAGFFRFQLPLTRNHKRVGDSFIVRHNRQDPTFQRFMKRFEEDGTLAINQKNYFVRSADDIWLEGRKWTPPKLRLPLTHAPSHPLPPLPGD